MTAHSTHPTGIAWVYHHDRHSEESRLIGDEHTQLIERPTMPLCSMSLTNRCSTPDTREVFKGNRRVCVFGCLNELLGNTMVDVRPEPSLTTTDFPQLSLTCFRAFLLELSSLAKILQSYFFYRFAVENLTITGYRNLVHAEVYANDVLWVDGCVFGHITSGVKVELAITIYQVHLSCSPVYASVVIVPHDEVERTPSFQRGQRHLRKLTLKPLEGQDALVVSDTPSSLEGRLDFLVEFVCFTGLGDGSDGQLCRQTKLLPNLVVDQFLDGELAGGTLSVAGFSDVITSIVECLHRAEKHFLPLSVCQQFDFDGCLHTLSKRVALNFPQ